MDFRQLQYFVAACEQRSMAAAARACRVTQPTLSAQMRRLETELSEVLFGRTPVGLRPTGSAQRLYRTLVPLLEDATHGLRYLRTRREEAVGTLPVCVPYAAASLMMQVARAAARSLETKMPQLKVAHRSAEFGASLASPQDVPAAICIRHALADDGAEAPSDRWLLIGIAGRRDAGDGWEGSIQVPALGHDLREALARWRKDCGQAPLRMHDQDAMELLSLLLAGNHGQVLVPRLAVSRAILQHPRLQAREIAAGLPPLAVRIDCADADDPAQRAYATAFARGLAQQTDGRAAMLAPTPLPDARQLRYFLRVFDEGCITRAAAKLNVVQPAVSMQIRTLERSFGGRLFERSRQGVHPTPLGRRVHAVYAPILEALQGVAAGAAPRRARGRPILRVGVLPGLDEDSLLVQATTATIVEWRKTFPNVELKVVESYSGVLLDWLTDNVIDIAVVEDMHAHTALKEAVLCSEPLALLTASRPSICPPGPIRMADIARLDLVLPSPRHGLRALLERKFADAGLPLIPKLEIDSMAAAVRLVKSGGWATVLPSSAVRRSLDSRILEAHPIVRPAIMRELRAVQLPRQPKRPWERGFISLLRARLSSQIAA